MRILVTGGCGFIGSHLIDQLIEEGHQVLNIDCLTYAGFAKNTEHHTDNGDYDFVKLDLCIKKRTALAYVVRGFDPEIVFHLAAETHVDNSIKIPTIFVDTNVYGTHHMLMACTPLKNLKKFIYISTDEVYGSTLTEPFTETSPIKPNSPYSASKASGDLLVRSWYKTYNFPGIITRCSNNYGPRQHPEKLIPKAIRNFLAYEVMPIYGTGKNVRDWIHVKDHCAALIKVMEAGEIGEVYNIGAGCEMTNYDLVTKINDRIPTSIIKHVEDRAGHDFRYAIDSFKIRKELGWAPKYDFEVGLEETIDWYTKHQDWWS